MKKRFGQRWGLVATAVALFLVSSVNAATTFEPIACGSSLSFAREALSPSRWKLSGFVEAGIWRNGHGTEVQYTGGAIDGGNGTVFYPRQQTTDFTMSQLWLTLERETDTSRGFDWGFRTDFQYGSFAPSLQTLISDSFDAGLLTQGDYGAAINQLYFTLGYHNLSISLGHFFTPVGWESVQGADNFFYTNSLLYRIEPVAHDGIRVGYAVTDRLSLLAGLTNGFDNGFEFRYGDIGIIAGFSYELTDKSSLHYYVADGRINNLNSFLRGDYWMQSLVWEWCPSNDITETLQWDVTNLEAGINGYGISYTRIVQMGKYWSRGFRATWCRMPVVGSFIDEYELSWGLNWKPIKQLTLRPEIRYDTFQGHTLAAAPRFNMDGAGNYRDNNQLSCGFSLVWSLGR